MYCLVPTCETNFFLSVAEGGCPGYRIPQTEAVRQKWIYVLNIFCGIDLSTKTLEALDELRICSKHFQPTEFVIVNYERQLLKGAYPTLFADTRPEESEHIEVLFPENCAFDGEFQENRNKIHVIENILLTTCLPTSNLVTKSDSNSSSVWSSESSNKFEHKSEYEITANSKKVVTSSKNSANIMLLNNDCLMLIFNLVDLMDLIALKKTCARFEGIAYAFFNRYKRFDFTKVPCYKTYSIGQHILEHVGPFIERLSIRGNRCKRWEYAGRLDRSCDERIVRLIPSYCPYLTELVLHKFKSFSSKDMRALSEAFQSLESLTMSSSGNNDSIGLCLRNAKQLQRLVLINNCKITGRCLREVRNLKYLDIHGCKSIKTAPFVAFAKQNKTLEYLNINCCYSLAKEAFEFVASNMTELSHLVCNNHYTNTYPENVAVIAKLPKLKKLEINPSRGTGFTDIFNSLVDANRLELLDLSDKPVTGDRYDILRSLTSLTGLKINNKPNFTDNDLAELATKGNFIEMHVAGCQNITEQQLIAFIRKNPDLKLLNVSSCRVTNMLIFSALDILKEQDSTRKFGTSRRLHLIVGGTRVQPDIGKHSLLKDSHYLLKISFECTRVRPLLDNEEEDYWSDRSSDTFSTISDFSYCSDFSSYSDDSDFY